MTRIILAASCFVSFVAIAANADTINGDYVGCLTKSLLDEFVRAAGNKDYRQMQALLGTTCVPINGREYSVVDRGIVKSKIRVYAGGSSVLLWTVTEATR